LTPDGHGGAALALPSGESLIRPSFAALVPELLKKHLGDPPREFLNEPGHAAVFAVGDVHSIEYGGDTSLLR
jgi:hypothetical protein